MNSIHRNKKRIIWGVIAVLSLCFYKDVYAAKCYDFQNGDEMRAKFGIKLDKDNKRVTMSSKDYTVGDEGKQAVFDVYVNNNKVGTLTRGGSIDFGRYLKEDGRQRIKSTIDVKLAEDFYPANQGVAKEERCFYKANELSTVFEYELGKVNYKTINCDVSALEEVDKEAKKSIIDCNNPKNNFEKGFCNAKLNAIETYDLTKVGVNGKFKDEVGPYRCEYDVEKKISGTDDLYVPEDPDNLTNENYFVNKYYLYATNETTKSYGRYKYHYYPNTTKKSDPIKCTRICEEAVDVEFGPPVAKKAGLCFEYKVRVTSRVSCHVKELPPPPETWCDECTPAPECWGSGGGGPYRQGGPNSKYDSCIKKCDGGKYTSKCTKKCYKKIYGNTKSNLSTAINNITNVTAEKTKNYGCANSSGGHCYVKTGSGVTWDAYSWGEEEGRWYREGNAWGLGNTYVVAEEGFYRAKHEDEVTDYDDEGNVVGSHTEVWYCSDTCNWIDCSDPADHTYYRNPGEGQKDLDNNVKKYKRAVEDCNRQATCATEKSEYTISAKHNSKFIDFPYKKNADYAYFEEGQSRSFTSESDDYTTLLPGYPSGHKGIRGCYYYESDSLAQKDLFYRTTWHFPGTWMNPKTAEISYEENSYGDGWGYYKNKFCIPFDQKKVNSAWWNAFYAKRVKDKTFTFSSSESYGTQCVDPIITRSKKATGKITSDIGASDIVWNIKAKTTKFGYFNWNINIECFYATNPDPWIETKPDSSVTTENPNCKEDVRVRSIELKNMFPSKAGEEKPNKQVTSSITGSTAYVGREPGFNWSEAATQNKNTNYASDPVKLINKIQNTSIDELYKNVNIDYEFKLTRTELNELRKLAGEKNHTEFGGNVSLANGVVRYKSDIIDKYATLKPSSSALNCNNIYNRSSCE